MKRLIIFILLTIALLGFLAIPLCAQTDSVKRPFCYTSAEVKFYEIQTQRAKEYGTQVILLQSIAKDDSLQDFIQKGKIAELEGQLVAKDTLISLSNKRTVIAKEETLAAIKQKKRWKVGFISSWAAFITLLGYAAVK